MSREPMARILIVDDDARMRKLLSKFLEAQGFDVDAVADAAAMDRHLERRPCDLVILDVMLPGENGFAACKRLRESSSDVSVIMLTAKGDHVDRIVGLHAGADDYISKPFSPEELAARIQAVLRRRLPRASSSAASDARQTVRFGPFTLHLATRMLTRGGEAIALTPSEFSLLKLFVQHLGQPLSRDKIMHAQGGRERSEEGRSIDVQVSRLRKLLGDDPHRPRLIKTVWGFGYALMPSTARSK